MQTKYSLLFDGQCVICRYLVKTLVDPFKSEKLATKAYQEVVADMRALPDGTDKLYPLAELERCTAEIVLVDEEQKKFIGGVEAVSKTLELIDKLPLLRFWLNLTFLKLINWLLYRMVAWHRYTWFIVPGHLRCAECELKVPLIWNILFFTFFGALAFGTTYLNLHMWFKPLSEAAQSIFTTIKQPFYFLPLFSTLACSAVFVFMQLLSFVLYKKVLGINKIEICKQTILMSALISLVMCGLSPLLILAASLIAPLLGGLIANLTFLFLTGTLTMSFTANQIISFFRWREINFSPLFAVPLLLIDFMARMVLPVLILRFI